MQAWIRTAASLITFGFSVYKFFQLEVPQHRVSSLIGSREFGVILVFAGLLSLVLGTIEFRGRVRELHRECADVPERSVAMGTSLALSALGIASLLAMLLRL